MNSQGVKRTHARELAAALKKIEAPEPPVELKQRLLAIAGEETSPARWTAFGSYAVGAAACVALAMVLSGRSASRELPESARPSARPLQAATERGPVEPPTPRASTVRPNFVRSQPVAAKTEPGEEDVEAAAYAPTHDEASAPAMTVTIGHAKEDSVGLAQAAAWQPDGDGGWSRMEWTSKDGPAGKGALQRLVVTEGTGKRRKVSIASVAKPKNEEVEKL